MKFCKALLGSLSYLFFVSSLSCFADSPAKKISHPQSTPPERKEYEHWSGPGYSENALLQEGWAKRFFFDHHAFQGQEKILDIGCGDGKITSQLAQKAPRGFITGIDQSSTMIERASSTYSKQENLSFLKKRAQDQSFYQNYMNHFDLVTSFTALHWVKEQEDVLRGAYRVLKPGGKIYFRICSDGGDPLYDKAISLSQSDQYRKHFKGFSDPIIRFNVSTYKDFLSQAGFKTISVVNIEDRDEISDIEALKKQVKSFLPHYHFLRDKGSTDLAEEFVDQLARDYKQDFSPTGSKIILIDHYLEIIAEKPETKSNPNL